LFSIYDDDRLYDGTITLETTALPAVNVTQINVPADAAPRSIRNGQSLTVTSGGTVGKNFAAGWGSRVVIAGGMIDEYFEANGSRVEMSSGTIGDDFHIFGDSVVDMTGGNIGYFFEVNDGSTVNLTNVTVKSHMQVRSGARVSIASGTFGDYINVASDSSINIAGGAIGNRFRVDAQDARFSGGKIGSDFWLYGSLTMTGGQIGTWFVARADSVVNISGGQIGERFIVSGDAEANISGGTIADHFAANGQSIGTNAGAKVNLFGAQFVLGGVDITGTLTPNVPMTISTRDVWLTGLLADGSLFDFYLEDGSAWTYDIIDDTATLTVTLVDFTPGDFNRDGIVDAGDYVVWRQSQATTVATRGAGADGDFDGRITLGDLDVWRLHFGESHSGAGSGATGSAVIPEPGTMLLAISALWLTSLVGGRVR
jgi:hypothetical protein